MVLLVVSVWLLAGTALLGLLLALFRGGSDGEHPRRPTHVG